MGNGKMGRSSRRFRKKIINNLIVLSYFTFSIRQRRKFLMYLSMSVCRTEKVQFLFFFIHPFQTKGRLALPLWAAYRILSTTL